MYELFMKISTDGAMRQARGCSVQLTLFLLLH